MIPGVPLGRIVLLFVAAALIVMAILGVFKTNLYNRLSTRIIALIFTSGLIAIIISSALEETLYNTDHPFRWQLVQTALIVLGGPVMLGLLAARFVQRPLRLFNRAIASLKQSNYKVRLEPTGIREFDEVFTKFNDLTDRLQLEEKLRKDLVSDTSHELNTPLTVMIGQLTAIQEGKYPMTEERVILLKEQAERLAELVHQLDAYTKARVYNMHELRDVTLKRLCKQLTKQFDVELKKQGIAVKLQIADNLTIRANQDALQSVITNLIQNALRYSGATIITITATANRLIFSDNGKGVPSESLPHLFERFYRVDTSRSRDTGGLGLGLSIAHELAEGQGWHIHAEDADPGLTFKLTFNKTK